MKKVQLILISLVFISGLTGCGKDEKSAEENVSDRTEEKTTEEKKEMPEEAKDEDRGSDLIGDITQAINNKTPMECSYFTEVSGSNVEVVSQIQGKKVKTVSNMSGIEMYSLFDGQTIYSWQNQGGEGTKITMECIKSLEENIPAGAQSQMEEFENLENPAEMLNEMQGNVECKKIDEIDLSLPDDIEFVDQCDMIKKQMEILKDLPGEIP